MVAAAIPPDPAELVAIADIRDRLWQRGWRPLAVLTGDKAPLGRQWAERARQNPPEVTRFPCVPHAVNTGVLADGMRLVDTDIDDPALAQQVRELAQTMLGDTLIRHRCNSSRGLMPYRAAAGAPKKRSLAGPLGKIEVLGYGQQAVVAGYHPSGVALEWAPVPPWQMAVADLPAVTEAQVDAFLQAAAPLLGAPAHKANGTAPPAAEPPDPQPADVDLLLDLIAQGRGSHDAALVLASRWLGQGMSQADVIAALRSAYLRRPEGERDSGWHQAMGDLPRLCRWVQDREAEATVIAGGNGAAPPPPPPVAPGAGPEPDAGPGPPDLDLDASPVPAYSDEALALAFAEQHADKLRYVDAWAQWLSWDGAAWRQDDTLRVFSRVRLLLRQAAASCRKRRLAPLITSARTVAAVERLARSDRRLAATVAQWDSDPALVNTPGGVVDLRTGQIRPHRLTDYMTRITAAAPGGDCPTWLAFLARITGGDRDLQAFLQRAAGYCLTGSTREQVLFFAHGHGRNGKSTFVGTLSGVLHTYATTATMETFTYTPTDRHPCDLAALRGARLVTAQETEDGRRWAESRVKAMTGGDPIAARLMRQDFFTYQPQFKLFITGNHRPGLRNVNEAIRRRLLLVPFIVTIPLAEQDKSLARKLRAEWGGILAWAIAGCLEWQRIGLAPPTAVTAASEEYLAGEDVLQAWMTECCDIAGSHATYTDTLYGSFKAWCELGGEFVPARRRFAETLADRGFRQDRDKRRSGDRDRRFFVGLALKSRAGAVPP